jgi:hypothetical protein
VVLDSSSEPFGRLLSEAATRPRAIVVAAPTFDLLAGLAGRIERVLVQGLASKLAVEAFDVGILGGFSGCDVARPDMPIASPDQHRQARKVRAAVHEADAADTSGGSSARNQKGRPLHFR